LKRSKNHPKEKWVSVFSQPPSAFIKRRLHSVAGLFLTFFLVEHLFVNSQSALFWGESGRGFIRAANAIHDLPYLTIIELVFLLVPFLIHGYLGVVYLLEMAPTSFATAGNAPSLPQYPRNRAYTWQRITATLLVVGILAHVIHMRFVHYPDNVGADRYQMEAPLQLQGLATALDVPYRLEGEGILLPDTDFGTAELFVVRKSFLNPLTVVLYLLLVLFSTFHGFNGLWTLLIAWGITLSPYSQRISRIFCYGLMVFVSLLGVVAIIGGL